MAGNECVKDAQELIKALSAHELPDGLPDALAAYSSPVPVPAIPMRSSEAIAVREMKDT